MKHLVGEGWGERLCGEFVSHWVIFDLYSLLKSHPNVCLMLGQRRMFYLDQSVDMPYHEHNKYWIKVSYFALKYYVLNIGFMLYQRRRWRNINTTSHGCWDGIKPNSV